MAVISAQKHPEDLGILARIEGSFAEALVDAVRAVSVPSEVIVALDGALPTAVDGLDIDALAAVVSVLVMLGVEHFETDHPERVRRIFDMHRAISAGTIEVLAQ